MRMFGTMRGILWLSLSALMMLPDAAHAQVGVTTDIITGVVVEATGNPLANVVIEAMSLETEITRSTYTDDRGRYTILFPDGGGQYRMTARLIGMSPIQATLARFGDEDRIVWDIHMAQQAYVMDEIVVEGAIQPVRVRERRQPGAVEQNLTPNRIANLPIDATDLNVLATLVPGVVLIDATDTTDFAFSVAGQRPDANAITLDGMMIGSGEVPQEGVRNTRVISSTYDVSRGGFSGGMVASTTRSGSNNVQGSVRYNLRDDALAFETGQASDFTSAFTQHQVSAGVGGPLIPNRLFAYLSGSARLRDDPSPTLTSATAIDLERLGIAQDSVDRFIGVVDAIGAGPDFARSDENRSSDNLSAMLRLDYLVSSNHTLTMRGDWRGSNQEPTRVSPTALPETGGTNENGGGGFLASLSSRLGVQLINEMRFSYSESDRTSDPYLLTPSGQVQIVSLLEDGSIGVRNVSFGGNTGMPTNSTSKSFQFADELSWMPGRADHRFKFGGSYMRQQSSNDMGRNRLGTYSYNSLTDLEAGVPASFRRTVVSDERVSNAADIAFYAGDVWRPSRGLQLSYGLRLEGSSFSNPPEYNPTLETSLGVRTDRLPSEWDLSPRAGFSWTIGGQSFMAAPDLIVRGGIGRFRSQIPGSLVSQAHTATGLSTSEAELYCVGTAVPTPDWYDFSANASAIPATCFGASTALETGAPSATVFSEDFAAPKTWRASLGFQRNLTPLLSLSVNASYARGVSQYGFRDLNFDASNTYTLPTEDGRTIFVNPGQIVPETGALNYTDSRIDPAFAQVLEIGSDLESDTKQLQASLSGITRSGIILQTSYVWSHVLDQSSLALFGGRGGMMMGGGGTRGGLGGTNTAGNPNILDWGRSSYERRHSFLATVNYPFGTSVELTAIGRLTSGAPYTPMVGGDINGDGIRNDRAFVFDPETVPSPTLANSMEQLLTMTSAGARNCLENQFGQIAERNNCFGPWEGSLELQLNIRPNIFGLNRRLSISVTTENMLRGVDELLHGTEGAHGWGLRAKPDQTLLYVTGFNPATNSFEYAVNERFGATNATGMAMRQPFQIGIQMRMTIGPDRGQRALDMMRGGGGRMGGMGGMGGMPPDGGRPGGMGGMGGMRGMLGEMGTPEEFLERFLSLLADPPSAVLDLADSLGLRLTPDQVAAVTVVRDSLVALHTQLANHLRTELEGQDIGGDPRALMSLIRPSMQAANENVQRSIDALKKILTHEQWNKLPGEVRKPQRARA